MVNFQDLIANNLPLPPPTPQLKESLLALNFLYVCTCYVNIKIYLL